MEWFCYLKHKERINVTESGFTGQIKTLHMVILDQLTPQVNQKKIHQRHKGTWGGRQSFTGSRELNIIHF